MKNFISKRTCFAVIGGLGIVSSALLLTSCADMGVSTYQRSEIGQPQATKYGIVLSVREITLESTSFVSPAIGAAGGTIAGALIGGSKNRKTGAVIGGLAGAAGGAAVKPKSKQKGYEYQVRLDSGQVYTMVQGADIVLQPGQRVALILPNGQNSRGRLLPL